jgi:hypothetical protein
MPPLYVECFGFNASIHGPLASTPCGREYCINTTGRAHPVIVRHSNHCSRRSRRRPSKMPDRNSCLVRPSSGDFNLTRFCWFVENGSAAAFDPLFCVPIVCRPSSTLPKQSSSVRYCRPAPNLEPFSDVPKRLGCGWLANWQRRSSFNVCWDSFLQTNREDNTAPDPPLASTYCRNTSAFVGFVGQLIKIAMLRVKNALPFLEC